VGTPRPTLFTETANSFEPEIKLAVFTVIDYRQHRQIKVANQKGDMSIPPRCITHLRPMFQHAVFKTRTACYCLLAVLATLQQAAFSQTVDAFNPGASDMIYSFVVQPDGRVVIGGSFRTLGGALRYNVGRVNADGTIDPTFNIGTDFAVNCMVAQ